MATLGHFSPKKNPLYELQSPSPTPPQDAKFRQKKEASTWLLINQVGERCRGKNRRATDAPFV
jgi:hypothetical protein